MLLRPQCPTPPRSGTSSGHTGPLPSEATVPPAASAALPTPLSPQKTAPPRPPPRCPPRASTRRTDAWDPGAGQGQRLLRGCVRRTASTPRFPLLRTNLASHISTAARGASPPLPAPSVLSGEPGSRTGPARLPAPGNTEVVRAERLCSRGFLPRC
ncbi:PREDICTED: uncharacterized protein DKFZp434B061-like [Chinchilla lanigera]|uniref:uncharacterized protein DKFZp434B061-like n=1 Tax=Chinchilla lanigera TaxID=34839 RepID=UPI000698B9EA|nr:PREDICTED: uncharacterized protein DKFZp434B061-like [Chinchilla lanigera]